MPEQDSSLVKEHELPAIRARLNKNTHTSYIPDLILGGIDGCVTTFAIVSGVIGAGLAPGIAMVLGIANLLADGFSMAISNYESLRAQEDEVAFHRANEHRHIAEVPEGETREIREIFAAKGFEGETLDRIVNTIVADRGLWVETMLREEHGLSTTLRSPRVSAVATFAAFVTIGTLPLIPFALPGLSPLTAFTVSSSMALAVFFGIGATKSRYFGQPIIKGGIKTMLTGGIAASLAFGTGYLLRTLIAH